MVPTSTFAARSRRTAFRVASLALALAALTTALFGQSKVNGQPVSEESAFESLGVPIEGAMIPATAAWPEGHLLYALAVEGGTNSGPFVVYDTDQRQVIYSGNADIVDNHRTIMVDNDGNAYFSVNGDGLARYDRLSNSVSVLPVTFPSGGWLRAATRQTASGWIYGVSRSPERIFRFNPATNELQELGDAWGYTTDLALDPTERYFYYMPHAHGGAYQDGAPVLRYDVETGTHHVIAFLNTVLERDYGYRIGGTYGLALDDTGDRLFINLNAVNLGRDPDARSGFGDPVAIVVNLWGSETVSAETPPAAESAISFVDVGVESGIDSLLHNTYLHTSSWGDVNNDGWIDLFAGTYSGEPVRSPNRLLLNRNGTFEVADAKPLEIHGRASGSVFADLDNDGDLDLLISNNFVAGFDGAEAEMSRLFRNDEGNFVDVTSGSGIEAQTSNGRQVGVLDYNGDGLLDLFIVADALRGSGPTLLLRNDGDLRFSDVTVDVGLSSDAHGLGAAIGDMTGNGWPDIFIAGEVDQKEPHGNFLYIAQGDGTYRRYGGDSFDWTPFTHGNEDWVSGASLADLDRDGRLDMIVGHHFGSSAERGETTKVRVYMNRGTLPNGDPDFEDITDASGLPGILSPAPHVELQDFDNDGWVDIYVSISVDTPSGPAPLIFKNNGHGGDPTFSLASNIPSIENPNYYAGGPTADFNRDGKLDIFLAEWRSVLGTPTPSRLMQNTGASGNWLQVKVAGDPAEGENTMGVGAVVRVYRAGTNDLIGARDINPSFGWSSSQPAVAHFGLGTETVVDVVVEMPMYSSSYRQNSVTANQLISLPGASTTTGSSAHMGLESTAITISTPDFLQGPDGIPPHTVAQAAPTVEFMPYDLPDYEGNPWSTWGGAHYAPNGRFYSAIGDHLSTDGNSFLYEYDPATKRFRAVGDVNTAVSHVPGAYGHGKIHSQITDGGDGFIYMTSYRGSARSIVFDSNFTGGVILRYPAAADSVPEPPAPTNTPVSPTPQPPSTTPVPPGTTVPQATATTGPVGQETPVGGGSAPTGNQAPDASTPTRQPGLDAGEPTSTPNPDEQDEGSGGMCNSTADDTVAIGQIGLLTAPVALLGLAILNRRRRRG